MTFIDSDGTSPDLGHVSDETGTESAPLTERAVTTTAPLPERGVPATPPLPDKFAWQRAFVDSDLPPVTRHVLLTLGLYMNGNGTSCYPSINTLCHDTGLSNRAVITHLQNAIDTGWLSRWTRKEAGHALSGRAACAWRQYQYSPSIPDSNQTTGRVVKDVHQPKKVRLVKDVHQPKVRLVNVVPKAGERRSHYQSITNQKKQPVCEAENAQPTDRTAAARPPHTLFPFSELPATLDGFVEWIDEADPYRAWTAINSYLIEQGNYRGTCDPAIVDVCREYETFIVEHRRKADEGKAKAWRKETWLGEFKRWIGLAWNHAMKSDTLRARAQENIAAGKTAQRQRAEAEERARIREAEARERAEAEARAAQGRVCASCRNLGEVITGDRRHCAAGVGRPSAAFGLHPNDTRLASTVFVTDNRSCPRWECVP